MRFKYYLRGIGLGILFSVIVMAVSLYFHKDELMSDDEIIKRASELGMVMGESFDNTETENLASTENVADTEDDSQMPLDDFVPGTEKTTTEVIPATENVESPTEHTIPVTEASEVSSESDLDYVLITVVAGDNPRALCEKLKANNIIEDADDFRHYIGRKSSRVLMVGEYKIPKDASYDDIIKIIFKK